jgi:hypothetical protein
MASPLMTLEPTVEAGKDGSIEAVSQSVAGRRPLRGASVYVDCSSDDNYRVNGEKLLSMSIPT